MKMINNQAGRSGDKFKMTGKRSEMRAAWLPEQRLADMDTDGIDATMMFGGGPLGTNYPHSETSFPHSYQVIDRDFAGIPDKDINDIVCERARKVYSVP